MRVLIPFLRAPPSRPNPRARPPNIITLGTKSQHMNLRGRAQAFSLWQVIRWEKYQSGLSCKVRVHTYSTDVCMLPSTESYKGNNGLGSAAGHRSQVPGMFLVHHACQLGNAYGLQSRGAFPPHCLTSMN